jgi:prepilin-type N-terminal cleavage/methylation domain-containing protein
MRSFNETAKPRNRETPRQRPAFTLVEMIVVITIMLILTVIAVAVAPRFQENDNVVKASDRISQWLLTARQIAGRDQVPTGVRLQALPDTATTSQTPVTQPGPTTITPAGMGGITTGGLPWSIQIASILVVMDPGGFNAEPVQVLAATPSTFTANFRLSHPNGLIIRVLAYCQELQYIQQPDDFIVTPGVSRQPGSTSANLVRRISPGIWLLGPMGYGWAGNVALLEDPQFPPFSPPWPDFSGGLSNPALWPVQPGDYLEAKGSGVVHYIQQVSAAPTPPYPPGQYTILQLVSAFSPQPGPAPPAGPLPLMLGPLTSQYRVIRAPRVLQGETPLELPPKVAVDITYPKQYPNSLVYDPALPVDPITGNVDILFSPSGAVTGRNKGLDKIMLWVRDGTKVLDVNSPGEMYLVTIQVRTGFIAVHPVQWPITPQNPDPYLYARDNRSSGL